MKQILVATDFSNCAANAMEYAMELAHVLSIEVCAIHAIHPTEGINNSTYDAIYIEDYYNNKRQGLITWAATFTNKEQFKDIAVTTLCEVGNLGNVVTKYVNSNPVEFIVMGTMGSTGISGLFGSNASMIVSKTTTPTLIVPLETKFSTNPVITLATDFSSDLSALDVNALNELVSAFRSDKLNVVNVLEKPEYKNNEAGENSLKTLIRNVALEFHYISEDNTTDGIMNFIARTETDILCVVKHHHNLVYRIFNRSTVNQIMNRSVKAILVLHE